MKIITATIQKGGTGKTTTATALAQAGVYRGKRILAVDLDPQGNFSFALGADPEQDTVNSYNLLCGIPANKIQFRNGIVIIPAVMDLATLESGQGTARRLQQALEPIKNDYDYIIIDTPTKAGELMFNAIQASTDIIIPLQADIYSLQSLYQTYEIITQIKETNPDLQNIGFILNMFDGRSNLAKQMKAKITEEAEAMGIHYLGDIRKSVSVGEATALQQSLFDYAPNSNPAKDYLKLFDGIQ